MWFLEFLMISRTIKVFFFLFKETPPQQCIVRGLKFLLCDNVPILSETGVVIASSCVKTPFHFHFIGVNAKV